MTYEHDRALMEGARNSACDDYFSARPQIDTIDRRRVYEAGFQAGAASRDAEIAELVAALKPFGAIDLVESRLPAEFAMLILRARAAITKLKGQS